VGLNLILSGHDKDCRTRVVPTPDPRSFSVLKSYRRGNNVALMIKYPEAENYEGLKILVFENEPKEFVAGAIQFDPHFFPDSNLVARFAPTTRGWAMATDLVTNLSNGLYGGSNGS